MATAFGSLLGTAGTTLVSVGSSNVVTCSIKVFGGDLVFSLFAQQTTLTVTAVSDNMGHSYTATNAGTDAGSITGRAFYTRITSNGTLTSLTGSATSSGNDMAFLAAVFAGPFDPAAPVDVNIANSTTGSAGAVYTCPATGARAQVAEVVICWGCRGSGTAMTATSPNLLGVQIASATVCQGFIGYQVTGNTNSLSPVFTSAAAAGQNVLGTTSFRFTNDILTGQGIF